MSLLLDALKKAADDKQKAVQKGTVEPAADTASMVQDTAASISEQLPNERLPHEKPEPLPDLVLDEQTSQTPDEEILTLDDAAINTVQEQPPVDDVDSAADSSAKATVKTPAGADKAGVQQEKNARQSKAAITSVSEEALSLLISKTNQDVKRWKRTIFVSIFLVSLIILVSGGVYYYIDTQSEIDELNRRHNIAMLAMRNKTSQEKAPQPSAIIRNLVSKSDLDDKVAFTKKQINSNKTEPNNVNTANLNPTVHQQRATKQKKVNNGKAAASVSFKKTNKVDPVSEQLEKAWQHYEAGDYEHAKSLYSEVLQMEKDNRDALLGLGAIAVIEKDNLVAREVYRNLLRMDPRDPIAIAALIAMQSNNLSLVENEKYLLEIIQSNPDAAELNFALANNYAQQEKWKSAQQYYFSAWQHAPENADYLFNLAVSLDQLGKTSQALRFYSDSLKQAGNRQVSFSRQAVQKRIAVLSAL